MGRRREFDENAVVDRAMGVFWRLGYDGATIIELTKAMQLSSPSIYIAFGSKRALFDAVLARYRERRSGYKAWVLAGSTAYDVAERLLLGAAEWLVAPGEPLGCLSVQAGLSTGVAHLDIPQQMATMRGQLEIDLRGRFEQAQADGDLSATTDPAALARYLQTVFLGMSLQAAAGCNRADLVGVAKSALAFWPIDRCNAVRSLEINALQGAATANVLDIGTRPDL